MEDNLDNRSIGKSQEEQLKLVEIKLLKIFDKICKKHNISYWLDGGTLLGAIRHKGFIPWDDDIDIGMLREDYEKFLKIAKEELPNDIFLQNWYTEKHFYLPMTKLRDKYSSVIEIENRNKNNHSGIFIDIFPFDYLPKNRFLKNVQMLIYFLLKSLKLEADPTQLKMKNIKGNRKIKILTLLILKKLGKIIPKRIYIYIYKVVNQFFYRISPSSEIGDGLVNPTYYKKSTRNIEQIFPLTEVIFENNKYSAPRNIDLYLRGLYKNYMELPPEEERKIHMKEIYPFKKCSHKETLDWERKEGI